MENVVLDRRMDNPMKPQAVRLSQAASVLGISEPMAYRLARSGSLRTIRAGSKLRLVSFDEIARFLAEGPAPESITEARS